MDPLLERPIAFAHRGARAHAPENTIDAFVLALRLGATGLETDAWVTADGVAVLDHDGVVRGGVRRRPIATVERAALPAHIPSLGEVLDRCGSDYDLSVDVKAVDAAAAVVRAAADAGFPMHRLWLCHPEWELVAGWRSLDPDVRLVDSTRLKHLKAGPERRAAQLREAGVDAINMHHSDWSGGLTTLFHRFDRVTFGWDAQHERVIAGLLAMGIDGVFSDHVDRMADVFAAREASGGRPTGA